MDHRDSPAPGTGPAQIRRRVATPGMAEPDLAPGRGIEPAREIRSLTEYRASREAAISAGHRALVRLITTR